MKLVHVALFLVEPASEPELLVSHSDLSSYRYLLRSNITEVLTFFTDLVAKRAPPGKEDSCIEKDHVFHYNTTHTDSNLVLIAVTDDEYPTLGATSFLNKTYDTLLQKYASKAAVDTKSLKALKKDANASSDAQSAAYKAFHKALVDLLAKYQTPDKADPVLRVQGELEETKKTLNKTVESLLERGEKMDGLLQKSDMLSAQSKQFYQTARKQNSCCIIM